MQWEKDYFDKYNVYLVTEFTDRIKTNKQNLVERLERMSIEEKEQLAEKGVLTIVRTDIDKRFNFFHKDLEEFEGKDWANLDKIITDFYNSYFKFYGYGEVLQINEDNEVELLLYDNSFEKIVKDILKVWNTEFKD